MKIDFPLASAKASLTWHPPLAGSESHEAHCREVGGERCLLLLWSVSRGRILDGLGFVWFSLATYNQQSLGVLQRILSRSSEGGFPVDFLLGKALVTAQGANSLPLVLASHQAELDLSVYS